MAFKVTRSSWVVVLFFFLSFCKLRAVEEMQDQIPNLKRDVNVVARVCCRAVSFVACAVCSYR